MSDSWSLNGKIEKHIINHMNKDIALYSEETINLLRQKLIKDMEEAWCKLCASNDKMKYRFINAWRDSINKRFGVDE